MTQFTNNAPTVHNNVTMITHAPKQLINIPTFQKTGGVVNGTTPRSFSVTAPTGVNVKAAINRLPTFLSIQH